MTDNARRRRHRTRMLVGVAATALGVAAGLMPAAAHAEVRNGNCESEDVCFWSVDQKPYDDTPCAWDGNDTDWWNGATTCGWADDTNVGYVYDNGMPGKLSAVKFYAGKNYTKYIGCTEADKDGALAGTYRLRSHKWVDHC